ncbi:hypothetical protein AcW1_000417 [Taiwanofungus camphoratus]|nr:hypothetical protein AcW1_000417 [Antrodia cinnamomea]
MRFAAVTFVSGLLTAVSAHFHLQYPEPRGPFNMPNELTFCDGYPEVTTNRTQFPLSGGFYSITSEHPLWTLGVLIATVSDPDNFANFSSSSGQQQLVVQYFETQGEGAFCAPINISAANIPGVQSGANVTVQFVFDGGDGELYQCADLTLGDYSVPSDVSCSNATTAPVTVFSSGAAVPTVTAPSSSGSSGSASPSSTQSTSGASALSCVGVSGLLGLAGAVLALI